MNVLLLLDMQNLWDSCCGQYGKRARVDLIRLIDKAKTRKTDKVDVIAFISIKPEKNQENLIKKLQEIGCLVVTKPVEEDGSVNFLQEMLEHTNRYLKLKDYGCLTLASGDPCLTEVISTVNANNINTKLLAFSSGLSKIIAKEADDIKILGRNDILIQ